MSKIRTVSLPTGSASSRWLVKEMQQKNKVVIVVTTHTAETEQIAHECQFFCSTEKILAIPDWEVLPYERMMPSANNMAERQMQLSQLPTLKKGIVIAQASAWLRFLSTVKNCQAHVFSFTCGQTWHPQNLVHTLCQAGYCKMQQAVSPGDISQSGSIVTIYPIGKHPPFRLDFQDDHIDTILVKNSSVWQSVESLNCLPTREFTWNDQVKQRLLDELIQKSPDSKKSLFYQQIKQGILPTGIIHFLSMLSEKHTTLIDYINLSDVGPIYFVEQARSTMMQFWNETHQRFQRVCFDRDIPWSEPSQLLFNPSTWLNLYHGMDMITPKPAESINSWSIDIHHADPFHRLVDHCREAKQPLLLVANNQGRLQRLHQACLDAGLKVRLADNWQDILHHQDLLQITIAHLERPDWDGIPQIIPDNLIFDQSEKKSTHIPSSLAHDIKIDLSQLTVGQPTVHIDYGVGRFLGLCSLETDGLVAEYVLLGYAHDDQVYVPVSDIHKLSRYGLGTGEAPLDQLGKNRFGLAKKKVTEQLHDTATELLALYAERYAQPGFSFQSPSSEDRQFAAAFPYTETDCQLKAIQEITDDLIKPTAMDRLLCGDVGFGKTEVAMRAAFFVAHQGKQVVVLVPTTLLAQQHAETFANRFAGWPMIIACLTRFSSASEQKKIKDQLHTGHIHIVIGTHKLLRSEICFADLGLLIIDEEHRFGVRDKEKLKSYRSQVDVLSMTATPIPRSLQMSYHDLRSFSIMATAPSLRLAVQTWVGQAQPTIIIEAIQRELMRGGQLFYVHNDIKTLAATAKKLCTWLPELKLQIAHGQMSARHLEQVMQDFYHQRFQLLLSTTIIENGLDLPQANTLLVDRADQLGLSQLHQLRGRVGRSYHQAYAYFFIPQTCTEQAELRLNALVRHQSLGAGFALASEDLEIRGSGELLGESQSGHIHSVGLELYLRGLQQAVQQLKQFGSFSKNLWSTHQDIVVELGESARLPVEYLAEPADRLHWYQRLAQAKTTSEIDSWLSQISDAFGPAPKAVGYLALIRHLQIVAQSVSIKKLKAATDGLHCWFYPEPNLNHATLMHCLQHQPTQYKMMKGEQLVISWPGGQQPDSPQAWKPLFALLSTFMKSTAST